MAATTRRASTISEYAEQYSVFHDIRENTLAQYRLAAKKFEQWFGGPVPLRALTEELLSEFLRDYANSVKPHTVKSKKVQLLAMWRAAADEGLCDPPVRKVRSVRVPRLLVQAWTQEEVEQLLEACRFLKRQHICGLPRSVWWDLAIRVAWDTGLRAGDQFRLRAADIRPNGHVAIVQSKTGWVARSVLSGPTMEAIAFSMQIASRPLVTPWFHSYRTFCQQFQGLIREAGVRRGSWKWLRRSSGTNCEAQMEGGARMQLGHMPGSRVADESYIDQAIVGRRNVVPQTLRVPLPSRTCGSTSREPSPTASGTSARAG